MFTSTGGTFTGDPAINATYYLEYMEPCLTFQSVNPFTIRVASPKWDGTMEYSHDTKNWITWDGSEIPSVDGKLYLRGTGNTRVSAQSFDNYSKFIINGTNVECIGNIETLLDWQTVLNGEHPTMADYCYKLMFYGCTALTTAPELPATTLAESCYGYMFNDCTSLTTAPALPATTLADYCYDSMFYGCTSLTTAPELPATTLAEGCYGAMFSGCISLTTAPALPATTLADSCYWGMFSGCTSLTTAPELPATTLANYCYGYMFYGCTSLTTAPSLPATTLATRCYNGMFRDCTALTTAPALPATTLAEGCYYSMFSGCTSLTTAPELPATTLASSCYRDMFYGCTNLKVSATKIGTYQHKWRIPTEGTISSTPSSWNTNMFYNTGGTFTGYPAINTTYYLEYPPVGSEPAIPPVLETPTNISVSGSTLIWDAVANAMSYNVYKDGILFNTVDTNSCDISGITEAGSYSFAVQALADGYTPSAISDVIVYEVVLEDLAGTTWEIDGTQKEGYDRWYDFSLPPNTIISFERNGNTYSFSYTTVGHLMDITEDTGDSASNKVIICNTYSYEEYGGTYALVYWGGGYDWVRYQNKYQNWYNCTNVKITFPSTSSSYTTNTGLIAWLQENATKIS